MRTFRALWMLSVLVSAACVRSYEFVDRDGGGAPAPGADGGSPDGPLADGATDGATDGGASRGCAAHPGAIFCEDFDGVDGLQSAKTTLDGATLTIGTGNADSPPRLLTLTVPKGKSGAKGHAEWPIPESATKNLCVVLEFSVFVEQWPKDSFEIASLRTVTPTGDTRGGLNLSLNGDDLKLFLQPAWGADDAADPRMPGPAQLQAGVWHHVRLQADFGVSAQTAALSVDGQPAFSGSLLVAAKDGSSYPKGESAPKVLIGTYSVTTAATEAVLVRYDDVVLTRCP